MPMPSSPVLPSPEVDGRQGFKELERVTEALNILQSSSYPDIGLVPMRQEFLLESEVGEVTFSDLLRY